MSDELQTREQMLRGLLRERGKAMSEQEKCLGRLAHDAFYGEYATGGLDWAEVPDGAEKAWESAAQAVAARVREECARIAEDEDGHFTIYGQDSNTRVSQETAKAIANAIRAMNEASQ